MHSVAPAVAVLMLCWMPFAYGKGCSSDREQDAAVELAGHLDSWDKVNLLYTKYRHCDDGSMAEAYSEGIARLLVDRWDKLPELAAAIERHPRLKEFVLRHIDATLNADDVDKIEALATSSCPQGLGALCRDLANAARHAGD